MIQIAVTKNKLIELQESNISYNILNSYYEKDSHSERYRKIYDVMLQNKPILIPNKEKDLVILAKLSKFENLKNFKIDYDLTGGKIYDILDVNEIKMCCGLKEVKKSYTLVNEVSRKKCTSALYCKDCLKTVKVNILDDKMINNLQDRTSSIANYFPIEIFLASIIQVCEEEDAFGGWTYNKEDTSNNTPIVAWNKLMKNDIPNEEYIEEAKKYINIYNTNIMSEKVSEFLASIKLLSDKKFVSYQDINTVSFLYKNVRDFLDRNNQKFVGEVGKEFQGTVKFLTRIQTETRFGLCNIYKFQHDGNDLTYMSNTFLDLTSGSFYPIKGKIKEHSMYKDNKQTRISNVEIGV